MGWKAKLACLMFIIGTSLVCVADKFNFKYWSRIGIPDCVMVLRPVDLNLKSTALLFAGYTKPPREGTTTYYGQSTTRPMLVHVRWCEESVLAPSYLIEFDPRACVDRLPIAIQDAIAAEFPEGSLKHGLYAMLESFGVTDIACTGLGYCWLRPPIDQVRATPWVVVSLVGFIDDGDQFYPFVPGQWPLVNGHLRAGVFDPVGISPIDLHANSLTTVSVRWPGANSSFRDAGIRCVFDPAIRSCSFYIVALSNNRTRLMVTHVLHTFLENEPPELAQQVPLIDSVEALGDFIVALARGVPDDPPAFHAAKCLTGLALDPVKLGQSEVEADTRQKRIAKLRLKRLMEELILGPYPTVQTIMLAHTALNKMLEVKEKPQPLPSSETLISEEKESTNVNLTKSLILARPPLNKMPKPVEKPLPLPLNKTLIEIMAKPEEQRTKQDRIMLKNAIRQGLIPAEENKKSQS